MNPEILKELGYLNSSYTYLEKLILLANKYPELNNVIEKHAKENPREVRPQKSNNGVFYKSPLVYAINANNYRIVKFLLENGASFKDRYAHLVTIGTDIQIVKLLVEYEIRTYALDNYIYSEAYKIHNNIYTDIKKLNAKN